MECRKFSKMCNGRDRTIFRSFFKTRRKLTRIAFAGLIVSFVPSIFCQDWSRRLTFDEIYNETSYVQLQQSARPFVQHFQYINPSSHSHRYNLEDSFANSQRYNLEEEYRGNEVEDHEVIGGDIIKEPLLVGFSHDPFRYSVPEEDYLKGVRNMNPSTIMSKGENRGKRGVLHLYNMMYCATGCEPLAYKGYGCYCGFLGSGRPTDGIDRCCKMHDECYENIYCPFFTVYFQPYYWKCYRGQPLCALENYHTQHQFINGCAARLCECDRRFAMCVKRYSCPRRRALCRSSPIRLLQNLLMFR